MVAWGAVATAAWSPIRLGRDHSPSVVLTAYRRYVYPRWATNHQDLRRNWQVLRAHPSRLSGPSAHWSTNRHLLRCNWHESHRRPAGNEFPGEPTFAP